MQANPIPAAFRSLINQAQRAGKRVLILSHIPEIDDPYTLCAKIATPQKKLPDPANDKDPKNLRSAWSTWNVTGKLLNDWKDVLTSDIVVAVLAGHLSTIPTKKSIGRHIPGPRTPAMEWDFENYCWRRRWE